MTSSAIRMPISNVYGGGDYTAPIVIGSSGTTANVILDTGSSTLAVVPNVYDLTGDNDARPTALAQDVIYGTGGWAGPQSGQASFAIGSSGMPQSILGLPLMNNHSCVFDRSQDAYGVIRFAPISSNDAAVQ